MDDLDDIPVVCSECGKVYHDPGYSVCSQCWSEVTGSSPIYLAMLDQMSEESQGRRRRSQHLLSGVTQGIEPMYQTTYTRTVHDNVKFTIDSIK